MRIYTWEQVKPHTIRFVQIHVILIYTVSSNLAIRSVPNSAVELPRRCLLVMKIFRSMHAQNKFYYKGVSEQRILASVAKFNVQRF